VVSLSDSDVLVGESFDASAAVSDADNKVATLDTSGVESDTGLSVDVQETRTYHENFDFRWLVDGAEVLVGANVRSIPTITVTPSTAGSGVVRCEIVDAQGNTAADEKTYTATEPAPPPPVSTLVLGCAIGGLPDGSKTRNQRFVAFQSDVEAVNGNVMPPHYLRVYLNESQTETLYQKWSTNHNAQLWPVPGDIWTPGTPHPHDIALSMKPNLAQFVAGRYDEMLVSLYTQYQALNTLLGRLIMTCFHEPYDNIYKDNQFTITDYKAMIGHLINVAAPFDYVDPWIVLTGDAFDLNAEGTNKDPDNFFVPGIVGVAGDRYQVPSAWHDTIHDWWTTERMFGRYVAWCAAKGVEAGFWEYGCMPDFDNLNRKSQDLIATYNYCVANGVKYLFWFDNFGPKGDWYVDAIIHRTKYFDDTGTPVGTVIPPIVYDPASANTWHSLFAQ
jgi:hypothetical protein